MSQPRQPTPSHSPTPSKSSLRRASSVQNTSQRSLIPPPSPRFDDQPPAPVRYSPRSPPNQTLDYESDEDDEPLIYPDPPPDVTDADSYFPHPVLEAPFQPFFTLIEDAVTSEHHHPSVHYIFADDDSELVTEAALRSIEQEELDGSSTAGDNASNRRSRLDSEVRHHDNRLAPPVEGVREHYLVLDIQPITQAQALQQQHQIHPRTQSLSPNAPHPDFIPPYTVASFASFSPDWQISSASITSAPTMGDTPGNEDEALMLRIEGRGIPQVDDIFPSTIKPSNPASGKVPAGDGGTNDQARVREDLESMIENFQSGLNEVRRLIDTDGGVTIAGTGIGLHLEANTGDGATDAAYTTGRRESVGFGLEEQD